MDKIIIKMRSLKNITLACLLTMMLGLVFIPPVVFAQEENSWISVPPEAILPLGALSTENFSVYHFTLFLKKGSRRPEEKKEINELQKFLNILRYDCGVVDSIFGPQTKACVIKFQTANGLVNDGIVGPLTRALLNK